MKKIIPFTVFLLLCCYSCNKNFYSYMQPNDILENGWYSFKNLKYSGELKDGKPHGQGKVVYHNGIQIEGEFRNGLLSDEDAKIYVPSIGTFNGIAMRGKLISGQIRYNDGGYYKGGINNYQPHGQGLLVLANGDIKSGFFKGGDLEGEGSFFDASMGRRYYGKFDRGEMDGEILIVDGQGKAEGKIYDHGQDETRSTINSLSNKELERIEEKELAPLERKLNTFENKRTEVGQELTQVNRELNEKSNKNYERTCSCYWNPCLTSTSIGYRVYSWNNYFDSRKSIYVTAPDDASDAQIRRKLIAEKNKRDECYKWRENPEFYKGDLEAKIARIQEISRDIELELQDARRAKQKKIREQQDQRNRRLQRIKEKRERELQQRALKRQREKEQYCESNPNACGCQDPERLRECAKSEYQCVCEN